MKKLIVSLLVMLSGVNVWASREVLREPVKGQPVRLYCENDSLNKYMIFESAKPYAGDMAKLFEEGDKVVVQCAGCYGEEFNIHVIRASSSILSLAWDQAELGVKVLDVHLYSDINWYDYDHAFSGTLIPKDLSGSSSEPMACHFL
ncbi:hypothetical protein DOM22_12945 [Bdellovibrio sp. ZAP7]|uniref:hypothetical protein n=1 Tax=Bdellovibrio sp. ZAP7 TaxID=2231053 RepID=UPI00115A6C09|nr:hypothetical protein [Bdellovibrio sp. ZAP7]QDK45994.1 hypothetical protein DOM22_12945 [Bdellovibrio sp. ZAP7]